VSDRRDAPARSDRARSRRAGRRLALAAVFEAEFGQRTPGAILERHLGEVEGDPGTAALARAIVDAVVAQRENIDIAIAARSPGWIARCSVAPSARCYTPARRRPGWRSPSGSSWHGSTVETRCDAS